jgi:adenylate kinase
LTSPRRQAINIKYSPAQKKEKSKNRKIEKRFSSNFFEIVDEERHFLTVGTVGTRKSIMLHARTVSTSLLPGDASFFPSPETSVQRTFAMLKPDVVNRPWTQTVTQPEPDENGNEVTIEEVRATDSSEAILERIVSEGFTIVAKKRVRLSKTQAQAFYAEHAGRSFYEDLTDFMSSGPVIALVLEKVQAIAAWRTLIGPTDSNVAREEANAANPLDDSKWTLRALFGTDGQQNACHGSDSTWSATREAQFFFPSTEAATLQRTCALIMPSAEANVDAIEAELRSKGLVTISSTSRSISNGEAEQLFPEGSPMRASAVGNCTALAIEGIGAINGLLLATGLEGIAGTLVDKFGAGCVYAPSTAEAASASLHWWFKTPFPVERTFAMIKPGTADQHVGPIMELIRNNGFSIVGKRKVHLTAAQAAKFYIEHKGKSFYRRLTTYMSSGPIVAFILAKPGAIKAWRQLMGPTNSFVAKKEQPNSIRGTYGIDGTRNATHGSDSQKSAQREISFFFPRQSGGNGEILTGDAARTYLQEKSCTEKKTMNQVLVQGLVQLCKAKPVGNAAVRWLGEWLVKNNPARPIGSGTSASAAVADDTAVTAAVVEQPMAPSSVVVTAPTLPATTFPGGMSREQYVNNGATIAVPEPTPRTIVFVMGGPGAGKGTQCANIVQEFGFTHLSTGDLLRAEVASGSERGQKFKLIMDKGDLVPMSDILSMVEDTMNKSGSSKFLLDGYPRTLEQAFAFEQQIGPATFCLSIDASDAVMKERLMSRGKTSGRSDDNEETITKRIQTFHEQSKEAIDLYSRLGKLRCINSELTPDEVYAQVRKAFQPRIIFVAGKPGAGKGTQCKRIAARYGYTHISAGDVLREEVARGSTDGATIERLIRNGQLVPDDLTLKVIRRAIDRSGKQNFLLDGYPRTMSQALQFEHDVGQCEFVLHIDAADSACFARLANGKRADDTKAAVTKRLNTFTRQTLPVINLYSSSNDVRVVNGDSTEEEVFRAVDMHFAPKVIFAMGGEGQDVATPCEKLASEFGYTYLSTSNLLKAEVLRGVGIGKTLSNMIESGMIVPVDVTLKVISNAMQSSGNDKFIVEGFPRAVDQVLAFESQITKCSSVLYFESEATPASEQTMSTINYFAIQGYVKRIPVTDLEGTLTAARSVLKDEVVFVVGASDTVSYSQRLAADCNFVHIAYDELLRSTVKRGSPLGRDIGDMMAEGKIMPSSIAVQLLQDCMRKNHRIGKFVITGFPVAVDQSDKYEELLGEPSNILYLDVDEKTDTFTTQTMPVVEKYAARGLCRTVSARGEADDIYTRIRQHYAPTIILCANAESKDTPVAMVNLSLATNCARVNIRKLVDAESSLDTKDGEIIRASYASQQTIPTDVLVRLLKTTISKSSSKRVLLEGFPRLVSAADSVVVQMDALQSSIGSVAHMLYLENSSVGETSAFRLETSPVVRFMETRGSLTKLDMADGFTSELLATASAKLNEQFDPESRSRAEGLMLAELTAQEQARLEAARIAAENDLGGGDEEEAEEDE